MEQAIESGPNGIGGWLLLPLLGLIISPIRITLFLCTVYLPMFSNGTWELLTTPGGEYYHKLWVPLLIGEIAGNLIHITLGLIALAYFFKKSRYAPILVISWLAFGLLFGVADFFLATLIPAIASQSDGDSLKEMSRSIVGALIWIPYFLISKRVKATFTAAEPSQPAALQFIQADRRGRVGSLATAPGRRLLNSSVSYRRRGLMEQLPPKPESNSMKKQLSLPIFVILILVSTFAAAAIFSEKLIGTTFLSAVIAETFATSALGFFLAKLITRNSRRTWVEIVWFQIFNIVGGIVSQAAAGQTKLLFALALVLFASTLLFWIQNKQASAQK